MSPSQALTTLSNVVVDLKRKHAAVADDTVEVIRRIVASEPFALAGPNHVLSQVVIAMTVYHAARAKLATHMLKATDAFIRSQQQHTAAAAGCGQGAANSTVFSTEDLDALSPTSYHSSPTYSSVDSPSSATSLSTSSSSDSEHYVQSS